MTESEINPLTLAVITDLTNVMYIFVKDDEDIQKLHDGSPEQISKIANKIGRKVWEWHCDTIQNIRNQKFTVIPLSKDNKEDNKKVESHD